ncbi:MAG: carbon starvation protein A [Opitutae bacterium]|nr:carbon starvation protein A [Opitutae bacterium]
MVTFLISIVALVVGYLLYGRFVAKIFGVDPAATTPAKRLADGIDYQELPMWRVFLIQLLNIAGLGPIFGAILGALYGPAAYIWIVLGCIFMGGAHDFFSGFASMRNDGMSLPHLVGKYLGTGARRAMIFFTIVLLLFVGVVFTNGPAELMKSICGNVFAHAGGSSSFVATVLTSLNFWLVVIFAYYLLSTILPIGKIIGKIYPFFGVALLFMVVGVGAALICKSFAGTLVLPELSVESFKNFHSDSEHNILFPMLFIVISCGAISGFHATQSPLMARCLGNERLSRPIFYGAMIAEGGIALIWATAAIAYFHGPEGLNAAADAGMTPAMMVNTICSDWLGIVGATLAMLGVVICPITSADTAFRGMRLILADALGFPQYTLKKRLELTLPIFVVAVFLSRIDFAVIWKYFGIGNQILATITLWTGAAFLASRKKEHWLMSIPALFLTDVCVSYFLLAPNKAGGLGISNHSLGYVVGAFVAVAIFTLFLRKIRRQESE